jgi:3-hydroxyisobutyrate dehydrogenase-like beta-hydroxyacid dehydrogenase
VSGGKVSNSVSIQRVAVIGFGEAGAILGAELARAGAVIATYDILVDAAVTRPDLLARAAGAGVRAADTLAGAVMGADLVISAVTAASAAEVARHSASLLQPRQWFLDINSVSPDVKRANAALIEAAGAAYVEAAVMAPVPPQRLRVPMLLGGARAALLAPALAALGMNVSAVSAAVGVVSAIKMCRSVMIKGLEALAVECLFAARHYGAENEVLASLDRSFPGMGWARELPDYLISRVAEHGRRRAAEMREVAATVAGAGIEPLMSAATARRQDELVDRMTAADRGYDAGAAFSWRELADALKAR